MLRLLALGTAVATHGSKSRKAAPMHPGTIGALTILFCVGLFIYGNATHTWTVLWFLVVPLVCAFGIAVGCIVHAVPRQTKKTGGSADSVPRMKQVYALLSSQCPVCRAQPGATCKDVGGEPLALIDRKWNTLCHFKRMEKAVQYGMVTRSEMIAQWDGKIPEGLNL